MGIAGCFGLQDEAEIQCLGARGCAAVTGLLCFGSGKRYNQLEKYIHTRACVRGHEEIRGGIEGVR